MQTPVYLDCNASTPCDPRVVERMLPFLTARFANPSSVGHRPGRDAAEALEAARSAVAGAIGAAGASEVVFTSGATEANNIAVHGLVASAPQGRRRLVTQATEHPSVLAVARLMADTGCPVTVVGVDPDGRVRLDQLANVLGGDVAAVSLMLANNETGALQPVAEAVALARAAGARIHCDAAQAPGKLALDVGTLGVDALSLSAHKAYGPKGIGALWVRDLGRGATLPPLLAGGGQEGGVRPGTPNLPGAVGLAAALELAVVGLAEAAALLAGLRDRLERAILGDLDGVTVNGAAAPRLPNTSNLSFAGVDGPALLAALDDIAVSTGSACTAGRAEPSPVLRAMGVAPALAAASLRISLGRFTTAEEVDFAAARIVAEVTRLRALKRRRRS